MNKWILSLLLIGGLVAVNPAAVQAGYGKSCVKCEMKEQQCKVSKLKKKMKMLWMHQETMGVKDEQLDKIKDIKHTAVKRLIQLKADKEILMVDLKSAMWTSQWDMATVNKLIDQKYKIKTDIAKTYAKAISDAQGVLTSEQRDMWLQMLKNKKMTGYCCKSDCGGYSSGKICPITGKALGMKGSDKGSKK